MARGQADMLIHHLRAALAPRDAAEISDGQLLGRFVRQHDEASFAALVRRHGPMVWGVCRRVLYRLHDAEDAFQATFLVLLRRAASVTPREMVGNWLYGVAHQTALKARATAARRQARERQVEEMPERAVRDFDRWRELETLLDQELSLLPEKYRVAIVLCDLEGHTRKVVARQLGLPEGTVSGRLTRGRSLLAKRLARRGLVLSGGALASLITQTAATASPPIAVVSSTLKAASMTIAGKAAAGLISAEAIALTEGVLKAMLANKLKTLTAVLVVVTTMSVGAGKVTREARAQAPAAEAAKQTDAPREKLQKSAAELEAQLQAARAKAKLAEAALEAARAQLAMAEADFASAQANVRQAEATSSTTRKVAGGSDAKADANAMAKSLASLFKYKIRVEIGLTEQHEGGRIEIQEVWGTRPRIEVGGQYLVRGRCIVPPGERGKLYFYETAEGNWGLTPTATLDLQTTDVDKDNGEFVLMHSMLGPGYFHLILTEAERYSRTFANVYFGTGDNVWRKK
jgi:RNA polymerase sigma factor (sigma-70 family)